MTEGPDIQSVAARLDENLHVRDDLPCRRCGYSVRGLPITGRCPECELPVATSTTGDALQFANPGWLGTLSDGALWLAIGYLAQIAWGIVGSFLLFGIVFSAGGGLGLVEQIILIAIFLISAAIGVVQIIGYWKLTIADPASVEREQPINVRTVARYLLLSTVIMIPLQMLDDDVMTMTGGGPALPPLLDAIITITALTLMVVIMVGLGCLIVYVRRIVDRIPDARLHRHLTIVLWGYLTCSGLILPLGIASAVVTNPFAGQAITASDVFFISAMGIGCFAGIGAIVFGIWGIVVLFMFRSAIMRVQEKAREHWSGLPPRIAST